MEVKLRVLFYNIYFEEKNDLEDRIVLEVDKGVDLDQYGADLISEATGFLVSSFLYEILD